jgi:hypothetical protein
VKVSGHIVFVVVHKLIQFNGFGSGGVSGGALVIESDYLL